MNDGHNSHEDFSMNLEQSHQKDVANLGRDLRAVLQSVMQNWFIFIPIFFVLMWMGIRTSTYVVPEFSSQTAIRFSSNRAGCLANPVFNTNCQWLVEASLEEAARGTVGPNVINRVRVGIDLEFSGNADCIFNITIDGSATDQEFANRTLDVLLSQILELDSTWAAQKMQRKKDLEVIYRDQKNVLEAMLAEAKPNAVSVREVLERQGDEKILGDLIIEMPSRTTQIFTKIMSLESRLIELQLDQSTFVPAEILSDVLEEKDSTPAFSVFRLFLVFCVAICLAAFLSVLFAILRFAVSKNV